MTNRGAPLGNSNATKGKLITEQIMIALKEECELNGVKTTKGRKLASMLVDKALDGNMSAAKEVLNRSDGAVMHSISIDPGQSLLSILDELERRADMRVIEGEIIDANPQRDGDNSPAAMLIEHGDNGDNSA